MSDASKARSEAFLAWFTEWWAKVDAESREGDPSLYDAYDEALREFMRLHPFSEEEKRELAAKRAAEPKEASKVPSPFFTDLKDECDRLGVLMGPEAAKAPLTKCHPLFQHEMLLSARWTRKDVLAGYVNPETEYGKTKEQVVAECDVLEANAKAALLLWTPQQLSLLCERHRKEVEAWQFELRSGHA